MLEQSADTVRRVLLEVHGVELAAADAERLLALHEALLREMAPLDWFDCGDHEAFEAAA